MKKLFFITFIITYIIIGYIFANLVGIKWDESATLFIRFLTRAEMALKDGWMAKVVISIACAVIVTFVFSNRKA